MSKRCPEGVLKLLGRCLEGLQKKSASCLEGVLKVSGGYLKCIGMLLGSLYVSARLFGRFCKPIWTQIHNCIGQSFFGLTFLIQYYLRTQHVLFGP